MGRAGRWLLIVALIVCPALARAQGPDPFPPEAVAPLQAAMDAATAENAPPGLVVWIETPDLRFAGTSGVSNLATGAPVPVDGVFGIGSISKTFTATVILQLAEEGVLSIDDRLADWLPEIAARLTYGDQITLRHLLQHTSGVVDYRGSDTFLLDLVSSATIAEGTASRPCGDETPADLLPRYVYDQPATFPPGEPGAWAYSNTGYLLLGMVIEAATGEPLAATYRARIFDPLGMTHTYLDCAEPPPAPPVCAYAKYLGLRHDVTELHMAFSQADGGIYSTAPDLARFGRALFRGDLFADPATLAAMLDVSATGDYGLGVSVLGGVYGHRAQTIGYSALLAYLPDREAVVVILANSGEFAPDGALMGAAFQALDAALAAR